MRNDVRDASDMSDERQNDVSDMRDERGAKPLVSQDPLVTPVASQVSRVPHVSHVISPAPRPSPASRIIGAYGGYRRTLAFGYVCLVYHATTLFCRRVYDFKSDPLG